MKHFIYIYREGRANPNGSPIIKTVRVYQIHRNVPKLICERSDHSVGEVQLVIEALEDVEALQPAAFAKNPNTGSMINGNFWSMEQAKFAKITRIN